MFDVSRDRKFGIPGFFLLFRPFGSGHITFAIAWRHNDSWYVGRIADALGFSFGWRAVWIKNF